MLFPSPSFLLGVYFVFGITSMISCIRFIKCSQYTKYPLIQRSLNRVKVKIGFTIEPELLQEVDRLRGITKRSTFLEYLIRLGIKAHKKKGGRYAGSV